MKTIPSLAVLTEAHQRTFAGICKIPAPHDLAWCDVFALCGFLGEVMLEANGDLKITRHGHVLRLPPPHSQTVTELADILKLRRFLKISEALLPVTDLDAAHAVVVINQYQARLFRAEMYNAIPMQILPLTVITPPPVPPAAMLGGGYRDKIAPRGFFDPLARVLQQAAQILIFGTGPNASQNMKTFTAWLHEQHPNLAQRVAATFTLDEQQLTESRLLAKAREFYASQQSTQ